MTTITFTRFSPAQAESASGLSQTLVRDWRHRDLLPRTEGHARYDAFDVASMTVRRMLADRGIGPGQTKDIGDFAADAVVLQMLYQPDAYDGDADHALDWLNDGARKHAAAKELQILKHLGLAYDGVLEPSEPDAFLLAKLGWLSRRVMAAKGRKVFPARFLMWWADGSHIWHPNLSTAFSEASHEQTSGPVVVLDAWVVADSLLKGLGRPIATVTFNRDPKTAGFVPSATPESA